ncbi:alpha-N-acetylgalactosaminide alpha-2,6-sialyltransferase 2 [Dorcoceras hygrometricum]|uniref:Alpha-N-acetylgalactosaminide alpha-2,6-sialyltransferase 2 n=1 Tax=Dorcoceras hygrometricum TaxID=472368 RepID=A0A2Z7B440_9LAMI|nr:alpha-N-acetylgalactosaminide alpha-2,6-sialyltransferase 2 [Dorcoceras hygrometricum]
MASSFTANALQINFDSVLEITDNAEMVSMFKTLESTGLKGFLGCPSVLYERELEEFFDTAMVCMRVWVANRGLVNLSEVPKDMVYDARIIFSQSGEPISTYGKKRLMKYEYRLLNDILAKSITVKAGSFDAVTHEIFLMMTAIHFGIQEFAARQANRLVESASETDEEQETVAYGTGVWEQQLQTFDEPENRIDASTAYFVTEPVAGMVLADVIPTVEEKPSADEAMTLEEILLKIPDGCSFSSTTGEVTKIQLGKSISIPGVDEGDWYKSSLPKIPAAEKGKAPPLLERDPIKGIPPKEIFSLILANINLLVQLREKACYLAGTCAWLQPVFQEPGASRLIAVDSSIRSTTRLEAPSSDCTRSPDEISTIGFSTSNWPEQISGDDRRRAAAHGGGGERGEGGGG